MKKLIILFLLCALSASARIGLSLTPIPPSTGATPAGVGPQPEAITFAQFARSWRMYGALAGMFFFNDACPASANSGVTTCYWISSTGADTNPGTTKASPWKHSPGMPTAANNALAHTPVAGEGFIFRGGETVATSADLGFTIPGSGGTVSNPIYFGVDSTWFAGASWSRPIFDCGGASICPNTAGSAYNVIQLFVPYVTVDNIEIINISQTAANTHDISGIQLAAAGDEVKNVFIHKWFHDTPSTTLSAAIVSTSSTSITVASSTGIVAGQAVLYIDSEHLNVTGVSGTTLTVTRGADGTTPATHSNGATAEIHGGFDIVGMNTYIGGGTDAVKTTLCHDNIINGSDATGGFTGVGIASCGAAYQNYVGYLYNCMNNAFDDIHGNVCEHLDNFAWSGNHANGFYHKAPMDTTANHVVIYNNVLRHFGASGYVAFYANAQTNCPTCRTDIFDNVIYDVPNASDPVISTGGEVVQVGGTYYVYNNTIEAGTHHALGNTLNNASVQETVNYDNNHVITSAGGIAACGTVVTCNDLGHNLLQTSAQAAVHYQGADPVGAYSYAPKDGAAEGIATGANLTSSVATIGSAFGNDTTYGVTIGAGNIPLVGRSSTNARPNSAWDKGAYQFAGGSPAGSGTLSSSLAVVLHGQTFTLTWTTANCSSASIDQGIGAVSCAGGTTSPITMSGTKTYTLTVVGAGGNGTASVTVTQGGSIASANTIRTANTIVQ